MRTTIVLDHRRVIAVTKISILAALFIALNLTLATGRAPIPSRLAIFVSELKLDTGSVVGGNPVIGTVKLSEAAPAGGAVVRLSSNVTQASSGVSVTVPAGSSSTTFTIATSAVGAYTVATITAAFGNSSKDAKLAISPPGVKDVTVSPTSIKLGQTATGTVILTGPAPPAGAIVKLSSAGNGSVQGQLLLSSGATSGTFTVRTGIGSDVGSIAIYAELNGDKKGAVVNLVPTELSSLQISPSSLPGGTATTPTGTITLDALAPKEGATVELSTDSGLVRCSPTVVVPSNSTYNTFLLQTLASATPVAVKVTARYRGASKTSTVNIQAATITGFTATPSTIKYGPTSAVTLEVTISGAAGPDGVRVPITTSNYNVIPFGGGPVVKNGYNSATVSGTRVYYVGKTTVVTLTATLGGVSKSVDITVNP